jgi:hypothetical protein
MRFQNNTFYGMTVSPMPNPKPGRPGYSVLSGSSITFDLSGMGNLTSSYATTSTALRIIAACKPHHYTQAGIPLVGKRKCGHYLLHNQNVLRQVAGTRTEDYYPTYCDVY